MELPNLDTPFMAKTCYLPSVSILFAFRIHVLFFVESIIGVDDSRHEAVAHDVVLVESHHADALKAGQDMEGLDESAFLRSWQVDLRCVARNDHLCVPSHAGQEHAYLGWGSVLCFV